MPSPWAPCQSNRQGHRSPAQSIAAEGHAHPCPPLPCSECLLARLAICPFVPKRKMMHPCRSRPAGPPTTPVRPSRVRTMNTAWSALPDRRWSCATLLICHFATCSSQLTGYSTSLTAHSSLEIQQGCSLGRFPSPPCKIHNITIPRAPKPCISISFRLVAPSRGKSIRKRARPNREQMMVNPLASIDLPSSKSKEGHDVQTRALKRNVLIHAPSVPKTEGSSLDIVDGISWIPVGPEMDHLLIRSFPSRDHSAGILERRLPCRRRSDPSRKSHNLLNLLITHQLRTLRPVSYPYTFRFSLSGILSVSKR